MKHHDVVIRPLARHSDLIPILAPWLKKQWPAWYGPSGRGDALKDLEQFASSELCLPVGLVALLEERPVGMAALKRESIPSHRHLSPWAAAGLVLPEYRRQGIGAALLEALRMTASELGYSRLYCATSTAGALLMRSGWSAIETIQHESHPLTIFETASLRTMADPGAEP